MLPRFGKMKVAAISHEDIDDLHRDITTIRGTPIRATNTGPDARLTYWCPRCQKSS